MNLFMDWRRWCVAILISYSLFLAACGGGGATFTSNNPPSNNPPSNTPSSNPAPSIATVTPSNLVAESGNSVLDITGTGFISSTVVQWNGSALATTFVSATEVKATLPAAELTSSSQNQITLQNPTPGGGVSAAASFNVNSPTPVITSISPKSVPENTATTITINGTGFEGNSIVLWNGSARPTAVLSSTELQVSLSATDLQNSSSGSLSVSNPAPSASSSSTTQVAIAPSANPAPTIATITPSSLVAESGDSVLDITGTGFISSAVVQWNGSALATTFVSVTEVKATLPAAELTSSSQNQITLQNPAPGGDVSAVANFNVNSPTPAITTISPRSVPGTAPATIIITGTGFEGNSLVLWNGSPQPTTVVSTTELQINLSMADLQNQSVVSISVSNPAPNASISSAQLLTVVNTPVIQNVSVTSSSHLSGNGCPVLQATISGQNFGFGLTVQANGAAITPIQTGPNTIVALLPSGFVSQPGALSFTVTNPGPPSIDSVPFTYPANSPPAMTICTMPSSATVFAGSGFSIEVSVSEVNPSGNATVTLGTLPSGVTSANPSVPLPVTGGTVHLQAANSMAAGSYDIPLTATDNGSTTQGDFKFTLSTSTAPPFNFTLVGIAGVSGAELGVPIGGSGEITFEAGSTFGTDYDITPSMTGLPPGTTATFSPALVSVGQNLTVTISASASAPVIQNTSVTLVGTPSVSGSNVTTSFLVDVTQPPGSLPGSGTDFISIGGNPYAAVYDSTHNLIFASNPVWNRIDVISNATHKIIKRIPVLSPLSLDITQDNSHVWVQTGSSNIYAIDTTSLQAAHYAGPLSSAGASDKLLALSDGTLLIFGSSGSSSAIWNPQTSQTNTISLTGIPVRSGDGTRVYSSSGTTIAVYNVSGQSVSILGSAGLTSPQVLAVNHDGSELVAGDFNGIGLYDQTLTLLGSLPGNLTSSVGILFSADNSRLFEIGPRDSIDTIFTLNVIFIIDPVSLNILGTAPASPIEPFVTGLSETGPFAIDSNGMILRLQLYGIGFEDSTFVQNYAANQQAINEVEFATPLEGSLSGGPVSNLGGFSELIPDVWFGQTRGSVSAAQDILSFVSPPSIVLGPVNLKFVYPDGEQQFFPQVFSYSTFPQYAVVSGSGPAGGAAAQVVGYGLPQDASGGTVTVGSNPGTITSTFLDGSGEPFPSTILSYTLPPGTPGWADLTVTTPIGTGTLPKSIFYAQSVTDYHSSDTFTAVLVDERRNQVYLSAGDHIDVFSTSSHQFLTPLQPAAQGSQKLFTGLALTPDGSQLLAADIADGSLAVISPDTPSNTFAIPITNTHVGINNCAVGPLFVAATSTNLAFVTIGSLPKPSCPPSGNVFIANLGTQAVMQPTVSACNNGLSADATSNGNFVAIGEAACIYNAQNNSYTNAGIPSPGGSGIAISGDGIVVGSFPVFTDVSLNVLGSIGFPIPLYGSPNNPSTNEIVPVLYPRLNASGSLYYVGYSNYFDIIDVAHAMQRMRFGLTEVVQNVTMPLAIDSGGRFVYLVTDQGLTVVDLGAAPLSIGHLSQTNVTAGTQIIVRGSGFDSGTTAAVGGLSALVTFTDENTLTLTIPAAGSGPQDIVLTRANGESYTLENAVVLP